ncbi:guanine deaminase-like protein [Basidiobolus meristosporus CBS 931.73]|uniref:Guanine deaminase n=1 Tax=Basidiobolus meristosporus CBS 931.73 TaxID=1314790 RepID=A0A1Y1YEC9_9FUNG|nr:guanine deaminase-like protein [Basidiobolus meristosporus CBS 931.73]|eukprot:ORX96401.1 guanine deaminase-like protein [Basidiobolus meristosporus CBS 931.73]
MLQTPADFAANQASASAPRLFYGRFVHNTDLENLEYVNNGIIFIDEAGKILETHKDATEEKLAELQQQHGLSEENVVRLGDKQFLMPGLVDTHIHAPQYVFTGSGMDLQLLEWLETYTFPRESAFKSVEYAKVAYRDVVSQLLRNGTTTACYYGTIHLEACKVLANIVDELGQRAYVGKVNMDRNSPDYYIETTDDSVEKTEEFIKYMLEMNKANPRVYPVLTPRFVPSCSGELMRQLGDLARKYDIPIQSHLCENKGEIEWVKHLHPELPSYTAVYDHYGLLTDKTIMAHCVHLTQEERELIKEKKAGISHCAKSNFALRSGVCNVRQLLEEDQKVGMGTDVSGGYAISMFDAIRTSAIASQTVSFTEKRADGSAYEHLKLAELLHLATLGGAKVMGLEDRIGNFVVGKQFDALLIDPSAPESNFHVYSHDDIYTTFEKFIYVGDDRNIRKVYVDGRVVDNKDTA